MSVGGAPPQHLMPPHYEFSLVTDGPPGTAGASSAGALDGSSRLSAAESAALHHVLGSRNTFVDLARTICSIHPYRRDEEEIDQLGYLAEQLAVCFGTGKLELTDYAKRDAWQFMTVRFGRPPPLTLRHTHAANVAPSEPARIRPQGHPIG